MPVNLLSNGPFDAPGIKGADGRYHEGESFDGWVIGPHSGSDPAAPVLRIWHGEMGSPQSDVTGPFPQGPWARIMGTITQTFPTEIGKTYVLEYETRATGAGPNLAAGAWSGGNIGFAAANGVTIDTFQNVATPLYSQRSIEFTATTELSFGNVNGGAVGIDSVSVKIVP